MTPDVIKYEVKFMKRNFSKVICLMLISSFIFSFFPAAEAGYCHNNLINAIYSDLNSASNIVCNGYAYTELQNARAYLSHAQRLLSKNGVSNCFDHRLNRVIDKAKMEILWNNRQDAQDRIHTAIRMVENVNTGNAGHQNHNGSFGRTAAGALIAAPVAISLGAVIARIFRGFNWGMVSGGTPTRINRPNLPGSIITVQ